MTLKQTSNHFGKWFTCWIDVDWWLLQALFCHYSNPSERVPKKKSERDLRIFWQTRNSLEVLSGDVYKKEKKGKENCDLSRINGDGKQTTKNVWNFREFNIQRDGKWKVSISVRKLLLIKNVKINREFPSFYLSFTRRFCVVPNFSHFSAVWKGKFVMKEDEKGSLEVLDFNFPSNFNVFIFRRLCHLEPITRPRNEFPCHSAWKSVLWFRE